MRLNWGHYILISIVLFMTLILYMVFRSFQSDNELVAEDYYAQELQYQNVIEKRNRAGQLEQNVVWQSELEGIMLIYPSEYKDIKGSIYLFRPSDKDMDLEIIIDPDSASKQLVPMSDLHRGKYILQVDWTHDEVDYFTEGVVFISK